VKDPSQCRAPYVASKIIPDRFGTTSAVNKKLPLINSRERERERERETRETRDERDERREKHISRYLRIAVE